MNNKPKPEKLPTEGYVRQSQLLKQVLPISPTTLWRMVKSGEFPRPVQLSKRIVAWRWQDVHGWMQKQDLQELV